MSKAQMFKIINWSLAGVFAIFLILWIVPPFIDFFKSGSFSIADFLADLANPYLYAIAILAIPISATNFLKDFFERQEKVKEDLPISPKLEELIIPDEKITRHIAPISYNDVDYNCIVSNFRVLLYTEDHSKLTEIAHENITTSSLERTPNKKYANTAAAAIVCGVIIIILMAVLPAIPDFVAIFPAINAFVMPMVFMGGVAIGEGVLYVILYYKYPNYYIQLNVVGESFQLYSEMNLLENMINVIRTYKFGERRAAPPPTPATAPPVSSTTGGDSRKYCIHCGAQILTVATFCDKCGGRQDG